MLSNECIDENLFCKIENLKETNNILAIVGTINPKIPGINFIPYNKELFKIWISIYQNQNNKMTDQLNRMKECLMRI